MESMFMRKQEITVPAMGESITEATVCALLKPVGSLVKMDDEILELSTDKVNQVLYAPQTGIFMPLCKEEDVVTIGQVIGYIEQESGSNEAVTEPSAVVTENEPAAAESSIAEPSQSEKNLRTEEPPQAAEPSKVQETPKVSPPKQKAQPATQEASKAPQAEGGKREVRRKMSKIRALIAKRLVEVQQTTAMLTTFNEVDLTEVMAIREGHKELFMKEHGVRLGLMSFFIKATVAALKKFPNINSYIDGDELVQRNYYSIGVAVGSEKGVVVPVIKECESLSFADIEKSIARYASMIKEGSISATNLTGGGFTITNGGVYGSLLSTPFISPNQCAILGMHKMAKRPMVIEDKIEIRQMMYLALSYDHRIVDGKEAIAFLVYIKNWLEDPSRMLLEI